MTRPDVVDHRDSIRFEIDPRPQGEGGCPLAVDLYRTESLIDAVVLYTPKGD